MELSREKHMGRWRGIALIVVGMMASTVTHAADKPPAPSLRAWLAEECPSAPPPAGDAVRFLGAEALVSWAIGALFDKFGEALTEAAKVDKEGRAITATSPSYLYRYTGTAGSPITPQRCLVVAHAASNPSRWCASEPFKSSRICAAHGDAPDADSRVTALLPPIPGVPGRPGTGLPAFYAEVELLAATDARGFVPQLRALYYPEPLHSDAKFKKGKPRNVAISVAGKTPLGTAALSSINVHLKDFVPGPELMIRSADALHPILDRAIPATWVGLVRPPYYHRAPSASDSRVYPVNLAVEVREVGKPNAFLQALAKAYNAESAANWVRNEILPTPQEQAAAQEQAEALGGQVKYQTALAEAYKAFGALRTACQTPTEATPDAGRAEVLQAIAGARAAVAKVRAVELELEIAQGEVFDPEVPDDVQAAGMARAMCSRVFD
jgi:hypothetical protein